MKIEVKNIEKCGSCRGKNLVTIAKLGQLPLAGYFPIPGEEDKENLLDLELLKCNSCTLVQASPDVSNDSLFSDYRYASRFSMKKHFEEMSRWIKNTLKIPNKSKILEIGSNDGTLMSALRIFDYEVQGVDPSKNVTEYAVNQGHKVEVDFFSPELVIKKNWQDVFDVVISTNSFAHISEIRNIAHGISMALKDKGILILEVQSWPELVKWGTFDFVYHEHKYYYDLKSLDFLLSQFNLFIQHATLESVHGGSYRLVFKKIENKNSQESISKLDISTIEHQPTENEIKHSLKKFFENISKIKMHLEHKQKNGIRVIGFGASGRANILIAHMNMIGTIEYILDESPERVGRNLGFSDIRIKNFDDLKLSGENSYDEVLILAWNFYEEIKAKWPHKNKVLINPLPGYTESLS